MHGIYILREKKETWVYNIHLDKRLYFSDKSVCARFCVHKLFYVLQIEVGHKL